MKTILSGTEQRGLRMIMSPPALCSSKRHLSVIGRRSTLLTSCALQSYHGPGLAALKRPSAVQGRLHGRKTHVVATALFEKFTERSIKSVMIAQNEAKGSGATEVSSFL